MASAASDASVEHEHDALKPSSSEKQPASPAKVTGDGRTKRELELLESVADVEAAMPAKKAKRLRNQTPEQRIAAAYRLKIEQCAGTSDARSALELYQEMKAAGVSIHQYVYRVVINVCAKAEASPELKCAALAVFEDMKADPAFAKGVDESIYSTLIKLCSKDRDFARCHALLDEVEAKRLATKLRTFAPLLQAYSDAGNLVNCLAVKHKLAAHKLELTEPEFVALLRVCTTVGDAAQFYAVLDEYRDVVEKPSLAAWPVLKDWFASDAAQVNGKTWACRTGTVDDAGVCSATGKQLVSMELAPEHEAALLEKIESLVRTDEKRTAQWSEFKTWLDAHGPFDVVIDAANVGYFNQNYAGGGFSYSQIQTLLAHYEAQQKRVLIVLHWRRTLDDQVPEEHRAMVAEWAASHKMFNCKPGNNDDWYWLYAAVKLGGRTLAVTNDEMRDHHFQMIHNRAFVRWKERHQTRYDVNDFTWRLHEPTAFSVRPQRIGDGAWHFPPAAPGSETWLCFTLESDECAEAGVAGAAEVVATERGAAAEIGASEGAQ